MVAKNSSALLPALLNEEIRYLIMQRFHSAFMRVNAAMDELEPDPAYAGTLSGFNLYFTVQKEMLTLDCVSPDLKVEKVPNHGGTTTYALMRLPGMIGTFASAAREDEMPRPSQFREALQLPLFDVSHYGPDLPLRQPDDLYVQFVYGRIGHELDFVKAVCMTPPYAEILFLYRMAESGSSSEQTEEVTETNWFGA